MAQREYNVCQELSTSCKSSILTSLKAAVAALNTLQSNYTVVKAIRDSGRSINRNSIPEMIEWLRKVGYQVHEPRQPNYQWAIKD
jgi:hypothetical protein